MVGGERGQDGGRTADSGRGAEADSREREDVKPIGRGKFGDIFAAFRGKAKAAWQYLSAIKSGQARGVFYRPEIGEIDFVWGDAPTPYSGKGLAHIDRKHVETLGDFSSMEKAIEIIDDVVRNGAFIEQDARTAVFDKDNYRVVVARDEAGNWILTAFDNITPAKEKKKRKDAATRGTAGQPNAEARAVTSDLSDGKDNTLPSEKQGNEEKSSLGSRISEAEARVNTEPTDAQKEAGNYRKGHVNVEGFDVTIEQPKGSVRRGKDADGNPWESKMHNTYGYIRGTEGVDGDHIDVFLSDAPEEGNVYVVDQYEPDGTFDEHKVMYGFPDAEAARAAYLSNYEKGWDKTRRIDVTGVTKEDFKKWIQSSHRKTKPFADYRSVKALTEDETREQGQIGGLTPGDKPAGAESEDAGAEEWLNENGANKRRRIINDRISGAYRAFQEADKAYSDLDSELLFGRKASDGAMEEMKRLHQEYHKRLDEYADSLIDMTDAEAEEAATDDWLAEDVRNRSMKYEYRDETRRKFEAVRNRLEGIRSARLGAEAYRKAKDLQEAGAGKKPSGFRIIEASDRRKNANYEGVSHIGADRVAMATNGRVLVVSVKDYDPSRADRRVDSRGNDLGVASGLQYRRVINRKVDIVASKSIRAEESARMTATLKGLQAKERAGRRIVVAFGRGIFRTYDASEWDVFLRSALHLGAREVEIYSDGVARAQGKDGVAVVLSLPNEGEADLRMDMSRGVSLHVGPDGSHPKKGKAVYEAARGLVEAAGIEVVEVDEAAAQAMLHGHEKTPVAGQPNRANEKPTSGSVLAAHSGGSSSNATDSRKLNEKTPVAGQPNRVNEKPTSGSVLLSVQGDSSSRVRIPSKADEKTPVAGQPNRANEKPTSGSVLLSVSGNSSSNRAASKEADAKLRNRTQSAKRKISQFNNGDFIIDIRDSKKAIQGIGKLLGMDTKGGSRYAVLQTDGGRTVAVRLADHGANGNNFRQDGADRNLSVVIERRKFDTPDSEIEFTEATIPEATFMERPHEAVAAIVRGVEDVLADREFTLDSSLGTVEKKGIRPRGLRDGEGRVYGWTAGGKVFLNRDAMDPETPVHEYTHLWDEMVMRENPELWERGKELMRRTPVWDEVTGDPNYADIRDDEDAVASEVHSRLTGARGAEILEGMIDGAEKDGPMATAGAVTLVARIKAWLADMFKALRSTLGKWSGRELADLTAEDFAGLTLRDLAEGMDPRTEMRRGRVARDVTEANPMLDDYHRGVRSRDDVLTFAEVLREAEEAWAEYGDLTYPDMDIDMLRRAAETGRITVYSSKPIATGVFVTPSRMNAEDYAGGGRVYSRDVSVDEVAWTGEDEGQYAPGASVEVSAGRIRLSAGTPGMAGEPDGKHTNESVDELNERFNDELEAQIEGRLPEGHVYELGLPGRILTSTGVPSLPIQLNAARLNYKATAARHDFELSEIKDLVLSMQTPVAVFSYGDKSKAQNILLEISHNGKNFVVGLALRPTVKGKTLEINSIRTVYPKDNYEWLKWITDGKLLYVAKEKIQPILTQQRMTLADVERIGLDLDDVAKIVENFENPPLQDEKRLERGVQDPNTMEGAVTLLGEKLRTPIRVISRQEAEAEGYRRKKGWYDRGTGQITVVQNFDSSTVAQLMAMVANHIVLLACLLSSVDQHSKSCPHLRRPSLEYGIPLS